MKHLPNELLYLLKVYNYIVHEIGLDRARSRSEEIREYIKNASFLDAYPTVKEYLSEDKSIDDIITYIQRNEKTYSLLGEWKDGEISSILKSMGIEAALDFIGGFDLEVDSDGNTYFTLPYKPCIQHKIVLLDADNEGAVHVDKILWLELYRTKEALSLEIFDDNCHTVKITFSDLECRKIFLSGVFLTENCKSSFDAVSKLSAFIDEKYQYEASILNDEEIAILPIAGFFANINDLKSDTFISSVIALFDEYSIEKGAKLLKTLSASDSEKKKISTLKKVKRLLASNKCGPLMGSVLEKLIRSQKDIPENI